MIRLAVAVALLLPLSGCPSFTTLSKARTLDAGESRFFVAPEMGRYRRGGKPLTAPQLELGGRYGVTDRLEIGGKAWAPGLMAQARYALLRSPSPDRGWDVTIAPGIGWMGDVFESDSDASTSMHVWSFYLPLHIGWSVGGGNQVVVGPSLVHQLWTGTGETDSMANMLFVGSSFAFVWQVLDSLQIVPMVAIAAPVVQQLSGFGVDAGIGGVVLQGGIGFVFGGGRPSGCPECRVCPANRLGDGR